jgi:hypothetical protein
MTFEISNIEFSNVLPGTTIDAVITRPFTPNLLQKPEQMIRCAVPLI